MAVGDTSSLLRLRDGLKQHFGPGAAVFVDPFLWLIGHVCVDVVRLDNWLMQRNPDYCENESMRLFIRRRYGRKTERFVAYWLGGEERKSMEQQNRGAAGNGFRRGCGKRTQRMTGIKDAI